MWSETSEMLKTKKKLKGEIFTEIRDHPAQFRQVHRVPPAARALAEPARGTSDNELAAHPAADRPGTGPPAPHQPPLSHIPSSSPLIPAGILPPVLFLRGVPAPPAARAGARCRAGVND